MSVNSIEIDIPCDPQQLGALAMPFALLSEAGEPDKVTVGAIVITADEEDPLFARSTRSPSTATGRRSCISSYCRVIRSTTPTPSDAPTCSSPDRYLPNRLRCSGHVASGRFRHEFDASIISPAPVALGAASVRPRRNDARTNRRWSSNGALNRQINSSAGRVLRIGGRDRVRRSTGVRQFRRCRARRRRLTTRRDRHGPAGHGRSTARPAVVAGGNRTGFAKSTSSVTSHDQPRRAASSTSASPAPDRPSSCTVSTSWPAVRS